MSKFSVSFDTTPVFIYNVGDIIKAKQGTIKFGEKSLNFIEQNGEYAYAEFFIEGEWPDEYYEDENGNIAQCMIDAFEMYGIPQNPILLKMKQGGWCQSITDLIQAMSYTNDFYIEKQIDEDRINLFITVLKDSEQGNFNRELIDNEDWMVEYTSEYWMVEYYGD